MSKTELSELKLNQLTPEQRLKITQDIVDDLVRALNVGNYSLVWRYFSDEFTKTMGAAEFFLITSESHQPIPKTKGARANKLKTEGWKSL